MESPRPENDPLSLQQHIRIIQERRSAGSSGAKRKVTLVGAFIAAILVAGAFLGHKLGFFGLGGGAGTAGTGVIQIDSNANPAPSDWVPKRPLVISIDGMQYKVNGHVVDIPSIMQMAKRVPAGDGQAVDITPEGTSKALAERQLKEALNNAKVSYTGLPD